MDPGDDVGNSVAGNSNFKERIIPIKLRRFTLPETNSSPMKISSFLVNTIKMVDFPWLC